MAIQWPSPSIYKSSARSTGSINEGYGYRCVVDLNYYQSPPEVGDLVVGALTGLTRNDTPTSVSDIAYGAEVITTGLTTSTRVHRISAIRNGVRVGSPLSINADPDVDGAQVRVELHRDEWKIFVDIVSYSGSSYTVESTHLLYTHLTPINSDPYYAYTLLAYPANQIHSYGFYSLELAHDLEVNGVVATPFIYLANGFSFTISGSIKSDIKLHNVPISTLEVDGYVTPSIKLINSDTPDLEIRGSIGPQIKLDQSTLVEPPEFPSISLYATYKANVLFENPSDLVIDGVVAYPQMLMVGDSENYLFINAEVYPVLQAFSFEVTPFVGVDIPIELPIPNGLVIDENWENQLIGADIPIELPVAENIDFGWQFKDIVIEPPTVKGEILPVEDIVGIDIPIELPVAYGEVNGQSDAFYGTNIPIELPIAETLTFGWQIADVPVVLPTVEGEILPVEDIVGTDIPFVLPTVEAEITERFAFNGIDIPIDLFDLEVYTSGVDIPIELPIPQGLIVPGILVDEALVSHFTLTTPAARFTRFTNMPFKRMVQARGNLYGLTASGELYQLQGTQDVDQPITITYKLNRLQFVSAPDQRRSTDDLLSLRYLYILCRETNGFIVNITTDEVDTDSYVEDHIGSANLRMHKVILGTGRYGHSFDIEITNRDGGQLDISSINVYILRHDSRVT